MAAAVIATTRAACGRSPQATVATGALSPARRIRSNPNRMRKPATSLGIMPAPGNDSVPNGKSPLSAKTSAPKATKVPPTMWSVRRVTLSSSPPAGRARSQRSSRRSIVVRRSRAAQSRPSSPLDLADRTDRRFDALAIGLAECREFWLIHVSEFLAEIGERRLELLAVCRLVHCRAQISDDLRRGCLGGEHADPEIVFDVVAEILHGRH